VTGDAAHPGRAHPGLTVELVGIPGAGKSRLARTLAAGLAERGVTVDQPQSALGPTVPARRRIVRKVAAGGAAAVADATTTVRMARALVRTRQTGPGDLAARLVQWLVAQHVTTAAGHRPGVSLLDEGVFQCLWSMGLRGDVEPVLRALARSPRAALPDVLVVVEVAPEVALARLRARPSRHSRTQLLGEEEGLAELRHGEQLLTRIVDWATKQPPEPRPVLAVPGVDDRNGREQLADRIISLSRATS
jgi:thymidylate kinase